MKPIILTLMASGFVFGTPIGLGGCVQLRAPKDPITINLNVKIDQEVRVRLDDDVEDLITTNPDLF